MGHKHPLAPGLYALLDDGLLQPAAILEAAASVVRAGCRVLQLRLERTGDRQALALIRAVVATVGASAQVIVNDRADLARLGGAAGVHLGKDDLPLEDARALLGPQALVGATCRSLEDVRRALARGADHAGVGPVFATRTKQVDAPPLGLAGLAEICRASPLPVVAIAGISADTIGAVAHAGAHAAAVGSALLGLAGLEASARGLCEAWARK